MSKLNHSIKTNLYNLYLYMDLCTSAYQDILHLFSSCKWQSLSPPRSEVQKEFIQSDIHIYRKTSFNWRTVWSRIKLSSSNTDHPLVHYKYIHIAYSTSFANFFISRVWHLHSAGYAALGYVITWSGNAKNSLDQIYEENIVLRMFTTALFKYVTPTCIYSVCILRT